MQPPRPKRRRRVAAELATGGQNLDYSSYLVGLEKPHHNMELLPQVLDTLHRRHNIKMTP